METIVAERFDEFDAPPRRHGRLEARGFPMPSNHVIVDFGRRRGPRGAARPTVAVCMGSPAHDDDAIRVLDALGASGGERLQGDRRGRSRRTIKAPGMSRPVALPRHEPAVPADARS